MAYDFYWLSGSPNAWRAMLTLEYKGVPYISHRLDPSKGELKTSEYLALNPRGKVPVLKSGDVVLYESIAIMAFVEREHPERPLFGQTAAETGLVFQRLFEMVNHTRDIVEDGVIRPIIRGQAANNPDNARRSADEARASLRWIEGALAKTPYFAGTELSAADIAAVTTLKMLERVGRRPDAIGLGLGFDDMAASHPAIAAWFERMEAMPGWEAAYPPHWRPATDVPGPSAQTKAS